ncbi:TetR/AcrR family transcriptional regulator [Streptomyces sp. NPDC008343]|uniref:TetR/AcrR family transcriptional regulator n=1 Tax=Streptomyces sp. NPDC008343 TaxID=3364828 RepID=UPI0036E029AF
MPRKRDEVKRQELLQQIRGYLTQHGIADVTLRPMARALGTSDRMLLYYFGSKEQMLLEALAPVEIRPLPVLQERLATPGVPRDGLELRELLDEAWQVFTGPTLRPLMPLFLEATALGLPRASQHASLMRGTLQAWTETLTSALCGLGLSPRRAHVEATAVVSAMFGLLWELIIDRDDQRTQDAFAALLDRFQPGWHPDQAVAG